MKQIILILLFISSTILTFGQRPPNEYFDLIKIADSLYKQKDYKGSADRYSQAFKTNEWKGYSKDRYNAACSWALAEVPDSAFFQLERIATKSNYTNYDHITTDSDLISLHNDKRWEPVLPKSKRIKKKRRQI